MEIINGYLEYFDRGILVDEWESRFCRFYDDGILEIYKHEDSKSPELKTNLIPVCNFVCVGHFSEHIPGRPQLHKGNPDLIICIPRDYNRKKDEIIWLLASTMDQLNDWMKAFVMTFPQGNEMKEKRQAALAARDADKQIANSDRYADRD